MIKKLKKQLKEYLNNKNIIDIFIISSSTKNKLDFEDIDLFILFREKDYKGIEDIIYKIKKELNLSNLHIEPVFIDNLFKEEIFPSLLHEGFSIN